ncbi:MAG TPA: hypothetical protein VGZ47_11405 [Gemmataceae bacterium]|jgi:hypothetical protein|nr:hypothetical protein [Gemmataceae bacterium]
MTRILDSLVSYFGLDENERPEYRRYFCYHIVAGPGPTPGSGVAMIKMLAIYDAAERCTSCQNFHIAEVGGPAAALAAALRYLDAYHQDDHVRKVQSEVRNHSSANLVRSAVPRAVAATANGETHLGVFQPASNRKG